MEVCVDLRLLLIPCVVLVLIRTLSRKKTYSPPPLSFIVFYESSVKDRVLGRHPGSFLCGCLFSGLLMCLAPHLLAACSQLCIYVCYLCIQLCPCSIFPSIKPTWGFCPLQSQLPVDSSDTFNKKEAGELEWQSVNRSVRSSPLDAGHCATVMYMWCEDQAQN